MWLFIHDGIKVDSCKSKRPQASLGRWLKSQNHSKYRFVPVISEPVCWRHVVKWWISWKQCLCCTNQFWSHVLEVPWFFFSSCQDYSVLLSLKLCHVFGRTPNFTSPCQDYSVQLSLHQCFAQAIMLVAHPTITQILSFSWRFSSNVAFTTP